MKDEVGPPADDTSVERKRSGIILSPPLYFGSVPKTGTCPANARALLLGVVSFGPHETDATAATLTMSEVAGKEHRLSFFPCSRCGALFARDREQ